MQQCSVPQRPAVAPQAAQADADLRQVVSGYIPSPLLATPGASESRRWQQYLVPFLIGDSRVDGA